MKVAVIGLGRMGLGIALRLLKAGHEVYGHDVDEANARQAQTHGVTMVTHLAQLAQTVRIVWLMVPAGTVVDQVLQELILVMRKDDIVIDGGNSHFTDSIKRAQLLTGLGVYYLDCGTSGGLHGTQSGYCLMIGGAAVAYERVLPLLHAIAAPGGVALVGPSGAGHYVKMVHNGIEYGLLQAYAEGFELLREGTFKQVPLDLAAVAHLWQHGAVIRSWLLELASQVLSHDQRLHDIKGIVQEGGTGAWCLQDAKSNNIPMPALATSLQVRTASRTTGGSYATKIIALLRNAFGGHKVITQD